jgi:hypothetical protein
MTKDEGNKIQKYLDDLKHIENCLEASYDTKSEIVYYALRYMKENPTLEIMDAFEYGYREWSK